MPRRQFTIWMLARYARGGGGEENLLLTLRDAGSGILTLVLLALLVLEARFFAAYFSSEAFLHRVRMSTDRRQL